jgi:hypothetical protein
VSEDRKLSLVWGVRAIAEEIRLSPASVYYKLAAGHIVSARKCGKEWVANREDLRREFSAPANNK